MTNEILENKGTSISVNGINMYYEIHGEGYPLLLLHGFTGSGADLVSIFTSLTKKYQLIIPDLRGHGRSTNPSKKFTHAAVAEDLLGLLNHLNITECNAVGFSAGGNALLHMSIKNPAIIRSMVIVSATPYYPKQARVIMAQVTIESRLESDWENMRRIHLQGDEQIKMLWTQTNQFAESYDDMNFTPPLLSNISAKTLIVQGDKDPLYPVELSLEMFRNIPNSSLWVVPESGHGAFNDETFPSFVERTAQFIE